MSSRALLTCSLSAPSLYWMKRESISQAAEVSWRANVHQHARLKCQCNWLNYCQYQSHCCMVYDHICYCLHPAGFSVGGRPYCMSYMLCQNECTQYIHGLGPRSCPAPRPASEQPGVCLHHCNCFPMQCNLLPPGQVVRASLALSQGVAS